MKKVDILVCSLGGFVTVAIYENGLKIKEIDSVEKVSKSLINIMHGILKQYFIKSIIYANGPGSFMGIKLCYVILKSISIVLDCNLYGVSGFELNNFGAIRCNKFVSFVLNNGKIELQKIKPAEFKMPDNIFNLNIKKDALPDYILQPV